MRPPTFPHSTQVYSSLLNTDSLHLLYIGLFRANSFSPVTPPFQKRLFAPVLSGYFIPSPPRGCSLSRHILTPLFHGVTPFLAADIFSFTSSLATLYFAAQLREQNLGVLVAQFFFEVNTVPHVLHSNFSFLQMRGLFGLARRRPMGMLTVLIPGGAHKGKRGKVTASTL